MPIAEYDKFYILFLYILDHVKQIWMEALQTSLFECPQIVVIRNTNSKMRGFRCQIL